jgi:hypothetical protein
MAVTAFPVLARIIQERGIAGTALGTLALAAGAVDDCIALEPAGSRARQPQSELRTVRFRRICTRSSSHSSWARCFRMPADRQISRRVESIASTGAGAGCSFAYLWLFHASQHCSCRRSC